MRSPSLWGWIKPLLRPSQKMRALNPNPVSDTKRPVACTARAEVTSAGYVSASVGGRAGTHSHQDSPGPLGLPAGWGLGNMSCPALSMCNKVYYVPHSCQTEELKVPWEAVRPPQVDGLGTLGMVTFLL